MVLILKSLIKQVEVIFKCLQNKGIICFPTETVYALACDATQPDAINKIYEVKARSKNKQLSILMHDIKTAKKYAVINKNALTLMKKFSPGPITYILPNKNLSNWPKSLGIRIPNHPIAQFILKHYPHPLVGTSTNISGKTSARIFSEIPETIKNSVDITVIDTSKIHPSGHPSTIVDLSKPGQCTVIRKGEIRKINADKVYKK